MRYVIIGNGVAGVTAAQEIIKTDPGVEVHIFGAEPYPYYPRPLLWKFIAGQIEQDALYYKPRDWYLDQGIQLHLNTEVKALEPKAHRLALLDGSRVEYDRLLLATGGQPFIPPCEGTDKKGVFTLRTLDDAKAIKVHAQKVSSAAVIGGGLLGLETARSLSLSGLEVTVVEFFSYLLPRQLDSEGAEVLQSLLEAQGLKIVTNAKTEAVMGDTSAKNIRLQDGRNVNGELVLFSTGIRSDIALAKTAGLETNHAVVVDAHLQTSMEGIYAAGDAAEFEGRVYGIIPPAIEQARVAASNMVSPGSASYAGTVPSTTLKVAGAELTSFGESVTEADEYIHLRRVNEADGFYRKYVLHEGRIVGAILLNDKQRIGPVKKLIEEGVDVSTHTDRLLDDDFDLKSLLTTDKKGGL